MRAVLLKAYYKNVVNKISILSKASGKDKMILELGKKIMVTSWRYVPYDP